jgi:site-specific recombinase XerD
MSAPALTKRPVYRHPSTLPTITDIIEGNRKGPARALVPVPPRQLQRIEAKRALREKLDRLDVEKNHSANTRRSYDSALRNFEAFCRQFDCVEFPATPDTVMLYLMRLAEQGKAAATLAHHMAAITAEYVGAGRPTPCDAEVVEKLVAIRRNFGRAQKPKTPVSLEVLKTMLDQLDDDVRGLRDQAILVVGFASSCRRSELAALDLADVSIVPEGLVIHLARSKVDQQSKGRDFGVQRGEHPETCPVRALEKWLVERGTWPGPLFCRVALHTNRVTRHRLAPAAIAAAVKSAAKRAALDPKRYAGHSLRRGCATAAAANGADTRAIAARLGHASTKTTERYIEQANLFAVNPLKGVL